MLWQASLVQVGEALFRWCSSYPGPLVLLGQRCLCSCWSYRASCVSQQVRNANYRGLHDFCRVWCLVTGILYHRWVWLPALIPLRAGLGLQDASLVGRIDHCEKRRVLCFPYYCYNTKPAGWKIDLSRKFWLTVFMMAVFFHKWYTWFLLVAVVNFHKLLVVKSCWSVPIDLAALVGGSKCLGILLLPFNFVVWSWCAITVQSGFQEAHNSCTAHHHHSLLKLFTGWVHQLLCFKEWLWTLRLSLSLSFPGIRIWIGLTHVRSPKKSLKEALHRVSFYPEMAFCQHHSFSRCSLTKQRAALCL